MVKFLKKQRKYKIFYIIGSDNLINFHKWKSYKELLKLCILVVFSRKGFDTKAQKSVIMRNLRDKNIKFLNFFNVCESNLSLKNINIFKNVIFFKSCKILSYIFALTC